MENGNMKNKNLLDWYQQETWRTCPDLGSEAVNLSHMVMGICSEYSEFLLSLRNGDLVNTSEELADHFWYISNYCNFKNYSLSDLWERRSKLNLMQTNSPSNDYFFYLAELQDLSKKSLAYGKEIDKNKEENTLLALLYMLEYLWNDIDFDLEKALENNINKLRIRFPDKFTQDKAINRNLKAERIELEK